MKQVTMYQVHSGELFDSLAAAQCHVDEQYTRKLNKIASRVAEPAEYYEAVDAFHDNLDQLEELVDLRRELRELQRYQGRGDS